MTEHLWLANDILISVIDSDVFLICCELDMLVMRRLCDMHICIAAHIDD